MKIIVSTFIVSLFIAGCAVYTSQDAGDVKTARDLTCNAGEHLAAIDGSVGARVEVKMAREVLENMLHRHGVGVDAGVCP